MPPHRWKPGEVTNPRGRPRKGTALAEYIREHVDFEELFDIAMSMARGEPQIRIIDKTTGRPKIAERMLPSGREPGEERPRPVSMTPENEAIADIHWVSHADRMHALDWIVKMGGLKPPVESVMTIRNGDADERDVDFSDLSPEQLDKYLELVDVLQKAKDVNPTPELVEAVPDGVKDGNE